MKICFVLIAAASVSLAHADQAQSSVSAGSRQLLRARFDASSKTSARSARVAPDKLHVLPYVADGGGWSTTFYFLNLEDRRVKIECEFVAPDGAAKSFKFSIGEGDFTTTELPPNGLGSFRTTGEPEEVSRGWAYCTSDPRTDRFMVHAVLRSRSNDVNREVNVPLQPDRELNFFIPFIRTPESRTDLILINTDLDLNATFRISIFDADGNRLAESNQTLRPGEQRITNLNAAFPDLSFELGNVRVEKIDGPDWVTGSALLFGPNGPVSLQSANPVD